MLVYSHVPPHVATRVETGRAPRSAPSRFRADTMIPGFPKKSMQTGCPTCFDGTWNGDEGFYDCGASCPSQCLSGYPVDLRVASQLAKHESEALFFGSR